MSNATVAAIFQTLNQDKHNTACLATKTLDEQNLQLTCQCLPAFQPAHLKQGLGVVEVGLSTLEANLQTPWHSTQTRQGGACLL